MSAFGMGGAGPINRLSVEARYRLLGKFMYALDENNIRIIRLMHELGPRNILEVARAAGLPPTSVYDRTRKLEEKFGILSIANLDHAKLGLRKCITLVESNPGLEDFVSEALAIPNYWKTITRCEGGFTHYALHAVPEGQDREFEKYMAAIQERGLVRKCETVWVSDYNYAFPNFRLYDPVNCTWAFEWDKWIDSVKKKDHPKAIHDPSNYFIEADKADLLILTELELNARARFSEISKAMGITLQAVKYRYDKRILPRGLIKDFIINLAAHPPELADMYEVLLSFEDGESMNSFFGASEEMFPILRTVKVLGETKLGIRTYSPHNETGELFRMLSKLARSGLVCDYSAVRLRPETQARQSISAELFEDKLGWKYDLSRHLATLDAIVEHAKVSSG
ncbi:MAG: winged helix-turn-helix transcriptional regulator [Candidatus Bathyarchaeia archaeon]